MTKTIILYFLLLIPFINCKSQESNVQMKLEMSFKEFVLNGYKGQSKEEKERYLINEAKFILEARNEFFSNFNLKDSLEMNLVEIFAPERPSNLYSAVLKIGSKVYFFEKPISLTGEFYEMSFEEFKKKDGMRACILLEMDKPEPNKIVGSPRTASYHFTVFISKIFKDNSVDFYIPNDICVLNRIQD